MNKKLVEYTNEINRYISMGTTKESMFEEVTKAYLFPALGYSTSNYEQQAKTRDGMVIDFLLSIGNNKIPIEIKPYEKKLGSKFRDGRVQLAKYIRLISGKYGILTDTKRWELITIPSTLKQYKVIWSYKLHDEPSKKDINFLECLSKNRISSFLKFADSTFGNLGFEKVLDLALMSSRENIKKNFLNKNIKVTNIFLDVFKSEIINAAIKESKVFKESKWKKF